MAEYPNVIRFYGVTKFEGKIVIILIVNKNISKNM